MSLDFLLRYWRRTGDENALDMVKLTARKMAEGGICDQLGDGFHRYAVDAIWLVPHFEKMLYDNAQLIRIYLQLFQITRDEFYKRVAVDTLADAHRFLAEAERQIQEQAYGPARLNALRAKNRAASALRSIQQRSADDD